MKKLSNYELGEYQCMIGYMMTQCDKFKHIEGPHKKHMAQLQKLHDRIGDEIERREAEAEKAYFKAHPELNP